MGYLFAFLFIVGVIAILCNALPAIGQVVIVLIKYIIAPLIAIFIICGIIKYGI